MGVGESSLESIEYYCIFWGKKKSVEDKEWAVCGGVFWGLMWERLVLCSTRM